MNTRSFHPPSGGPALALTTWGADHGRATLILHGYLDQGPAWDPVARHLNRRVLAHDHRGHGRSDHAPPGCGYPFWDYVADADAVLSTLLDGGPVDLIGHSMGGTVATLLAAARPEQVHRLALLEGLGPPDATNEALDRARRFLDERLQTPRHSRLPDVPTAAERLRRMNPGLPPAQALALATRVTRPALPDDPHAEPGEGGLVWTWDPLHRGRSPVPFRAELHKRYLAHLTMPVLLVEGERSPMRHLPDRDARIAALPAPPQLALLNAGHNLHYDAPAALAEALAAFFDAP